jgi:oxygen-independent coproporphyrinogen-3 oxidase
MLPKLPGIYVHLPFCAVHCIYCDFPLTTRLSLSDRYYEALRTEIKMHPPEAQADTLYFGGGTPSLTPTDVLKRVIDSFNMTPDAEVTMEANPDHVSYSKLAEWKEMGINRISMGIQSLEERVLKMMLRQHTKDIALRSLEMARERGFENINVDLMLGFPGQSTEGFLGGIDHLLRFRPEHFSIYLLELHENTGLHRLVERGRTAVMPEDQQIDCFQQAVKMLKESGYQRYEVSNFALAGMESRHNLKYWTDQPYYAFGAGACSYGNYRRTRNHRHVSTYIEAIEQGITIYEEEILESEDTRLRNALIFGLRKTQGVNVPAFITEYNRNPLDLFGESLDEYIRSGLVDFSNAYLRLTEQGLLVSNEILSTVL